MDVAHKDKHQEMPGTNIKDEDHSSEEKKFVN